MYYKEEHIVEGSINKSVCKCLWQGWMRGNMSIQRIVQITVYGILYTVYTVIPSPQPGSLSSCPGSVLPLCLWSPDVIIPGAGAWSGRGVPHYHTLASFRSHNIQDWADTRTRSAFIILVTLHLSDVTWYETLSLGLMADVWYSLDRDTRGEGAAIPDC